jgi:hypothetical protein
MKTPTQPTSDILDITLTMAGNAVSRFLPLLGEGILLKGLGGESVQEFLVNTAGVSPAYLKERVQTVFLNGKALDDFNTARVAEGSTLALSAAMPGLAGAVLRRGGIYAPMRRQISHETQLQNAGGGEIFVTLKLFNMVARELGPEFLKRGVLVQGLRLRDFLKRQQRWAWDGCLSVKAADQPVRPEQVVELIANRQWIRLSIHTPKNQTAS